MSLCGSSCFNCFLSKKSASILYYLFIHSWFLPKVRSGKRSLSCYNIKKAIVIDCEIYFLYRVRFTGQCVFYCDRKFLPPICETRLITSTTWFLLFTSIAAREVTLSCFDLLALFFLSLLLRWRESCAGFFNQQWLRIRRGGQEILQWISVRKKTVIWIVCVADKEDAS